MVNCLFKKNKNYYWYFSINNHTGKNQREKLVCAGISAVVFGILNTLESTKIQSYINKSKNKIIITKISSNGEIQIIINTLYICLKTIEDKYPDLILIKEVTDDNNQT